MQLPYRPDIDGLRAVAVVSVLLFHAELGWFSGGFVGVDVFFVISGYLISGLLFKEFEATGSIDILAFWVRRMYRLLPLALIVILATLVAARLILGPVVVTSTARDALHATLYTLNWQQAFMAVNYFADDRSLSPFLHFWSLAVEEQFYLFMSLCFALSIDAGRLLGRPAAWVHKVLFAVFIFSAILSIGAALHHIATAQSLAFFGTHSRVWQLLCGVILYMVTARHGPLPERLRTPLGVLGFGAVALTVVFYESGMLYPDQWALLPTLGAVLIIASGFRESHEMPAAVTKILSLRPLTVIGRLSYALYLWHWPILFFSAAWLGVSTTAQVTLALAVSFVVAAVSHRYIENPIRYGQILVLRPAYSLGVAIAATVAVAGIAYVMNNAPAGSHIRLAGGGAFDAREVRRDVARIYDDGCHVSYAGADYGPCVYGDATSAEKIFLFGDSHAAHWFPAFERIAEKSGKALYVRTKNSCATADVALFLQAAKREYVECEVWRRKVLEEIERERPSVVVLGNFSFYMPFDRSTGSVVPEDDRLAVLAAAERRVIDRIQAIGARVVLLADTPRLPGDPIDCMLTNVRREDVCRWPREAVLKDRSPWIFGLDEDLENRRFSPPIVDLADEICRNGWCAAARNNTIVMRDKHHITATFARTLTVALAVRLDHALDGWLGGPGTPVARPRRPGEPTDRSVGLFGSPRQPKWPDDGATRRSFWPVSLWRRDRRTP